MSSRMVSPEEQAELSAYLDGELDAAAAAALRARIDADPALAQVLRELGAVDEGLRAIPPAEVSDELAARVRDRIAAERGNAEVVALRRTRAVSRRRRPLRPVLYAAAALAATVALALLMRAQFEGGPEPRIAPLPEPLLPLEQPLEERALPQLEELEARERVAPKLPAPPPSIPVPELSTPRELPRSPEPAPTPAPRPVPERVAEQTPDALETATDEDLLLALGLEALGAEAGELEDLAIIEQLEFVELLRLLEEGGRRG